ncbi:PDZ domain-containing protein [Nakamurella sp. YIM 132087]|uniref:PDZ domain-containing protein n=1 Tax=Nakamurella alba TaxID=2665158 RepID=A0A7K1FGL3_9ACTN|nr:PDZ domain-containing protein [Nakamurella alba]MTD13200.1 PDZ domain-containing protein [Nakamurella alba]
MNWFLSRSLRARTLIVGSVLGAALIAVGFTVPLPYVALGPGVTYNTLDDVDGTEVIGFSGDDIPASVQENSATGHLNMTTISIYDHQTLFSALGLWAQGDFSLVPREEVYPPDKTVEQVNQENAALFSDSQSSAEIAALRYLKYPNVVYVGTIPDDSPSAKVLEPQDQITAIDGTAVSDFASLRTALADTTPGQTVTVTVLRDGAEQDEKVVLQAAADPATSGSQGFLGIGAVERPKAPFSISISLANIGGPSAGLMFTLGIIDKLTPGDLTSGHFIAGTGTMEVDDDKGTVGAIGGILMKQVAARDAGATIFLVPEANCAEALTRVPDGLQLVKVATLDDAMNALKTIADGGTPPGC